MARFVETHGDLKIGDKVEITKERHAFKGRQGKVSRILIEANRDGGAAICVLLKKASADIGRVHCWVNDDDIEKVAKDS